MNVAIRERGTGQVVVRYEVHKARGGRTPPDVEYFDDAWQRAVTDGLVDPSQREQYEFQLQRPKTLYESSL